MKPLLYISILLGAIAVFAQDPYGQPQPNGYDPAVDQGQYYEYAEEASYPQQYYAPAPQDAYGQPVQNGYAPAPQYMNAQPNGYALPQPNGYAPAPQYGNPQPAPYGYAPAPYLLPDDSTVYYQNLIEQYTESGNSKRALGKFLMIAGGIGTGVGILLIAASDEGDCDDYGRHCHENESLTTTGVLIGIGGTAAFITGIIVKSSGGRRLRKADYYRQNLQQYQFRRMQGFSIRLEPQLDIINRNYGGKVALNF